MPKHKRTTKEPVEAIINGADKDVLTLKQARFAHAYFELANGIEAYKCAYDARNMSYAAIGVEAHRLLQNPKVALKLAKLRKAAEEAVVLDRAWVLRRLMRNARIAMGEETIKLRTRMAKSDDIIEIEVTDRDAAAANKALELLGKTPELALFIDRHEHGGIDAFDQMSDDELRRYVAEEAKALGIELTAPRPNGSTKH